MATTSEVMSALSGAVKEGHIKTKTLKGNSIRFIEWHTAVRLLDQHAPGWTGEVKSIVCDAGRVAVVYRLGIPTDDAGTVYREAIGNEDDEAAGYGDPFSNAEAMAFKRAAAKFGLGLDLYRKDWKPERDDGRTYDTGNGKAVASYASANAHGTNLRQVEANPTRASYATVFNNRMKEWGYDAAGKQRMMVAVTGKSDGKALPDEEWAALAGVVSKLHSKQEAETYMLREEGSRTYKGVGNLDAVAKDYAKSTGANVVTVRSSGRAVPDDGAPEPIFSD